MRNFSLVCLCFAVVAYAVPTQAAFITWGSRATIVDFYDSGANPGDDDLLNNGTFKAAVSMNDADLTVNGVPLKGGRAISGGAVTWAGTGSSISMDWSLISGAGTATPAIFPHVFVPTHTGQPETHADLTNTAYKQALHMAITQPYVGGWPNGTAHINFNDLTIGNTYQIQFIAPMNINAGGIIKLAGGPGGEVMTPAGTAGSNAMGLGYIGAGTRNTYLSSTSNATPSKVFGTFIADATTQVIHMDKWSTGYGLYSPGIISIRTTVDLIPEPSTVILLATGLLGLLAYAWRRRRA